jgi:hypothetical protein
MTAAKFVAVHPGDVVRLRKQHPCGGADWTVVRIGADIGLRCETCRHRVLLPRSQFERRLKTFLRRARAEEPATGALSGRATGAGAAPSHPGEAGSE